MIPFQLMPINNRISRRQKQIIFSLIDLAVFAIAIYLAFFLRFEKPTDRLRYLQDYRELIYLLFPIKIVFFRLAGIYRPVLRYMGTEFLMTSVIAVGGSTGLLALTGFFLRIDLFPRSIFILDAGLTLMMMIGARIGVRWLVYYSPIPQIGNGNCKEKIIVYGAGDGGSQLARALDHDSRYKVIAFVDDNPYLIGQLVGGIRVYPEKAMIGLIGKKQVGTVLMANPSATHRQKKVELVQQLREYAVTIKTIPRINEIVSGRISVSEIRNIDIVDLLGREEVAPLPELLKKDVTGKVVMVTGAGGSIGSELCRQIAKLAPRCLVLYELNEFALYNIGIELADNCPEIHVIPCLATVLNRAFMERTLIGHGVETIYHAAAYKHVPLIEENKTVGVVNNVKGTLTCVQSAVQCGVKTFVLISTDKAVRPTNVMGATKRVAELILQATAARTASTRFIIVRFGNVLDSAGSVVPRFRKQIAEGKNLTVTHKEIERFFMSIPEAARLVIQAGALGTGGDVFLLDMGEPVKIYDLARQMIELSGLTLGQDIDIDIKGLRPGEKLYEELLIDPDQQESTIHPKIFKAEEQSIPWEQLEALLENLFAAATAQDDDTVLAELKRIVPEFRHGCKTD
jgi:FlaA1/EpsC-like NDP-sugar epimerase